MNKNRVTMKNLVASYCFALKFIDSKGFGEEFRALLKEKHT